MLPFKSWTRDTSSPSPQHTHRVVIQACEHQRAVWHQPNHSVLKVCSYMCSLVKDLNETGEKNNINYCTTQKCSHLIREMLLLMLLMIKTMMRMMKMMLFLPLWLALSLSHGAALSRAECWLKHSPALLDTGHDPLCSSALASLIVSSTPLLIVVIAV